MGLGAPDDSIGMTVMAGKIAARRVSRDPGRQSRTIGKSAGGRRQAWGAVEMLKLRVPEKIAVAATYTLATWRKTPSPTGCVSASSRAIWIRPVDGRHDRPGRIAIRSPQAGDARSPRSCSTPGNQKCQTPTPRKPPAMLDGAAAAHQGTEYSNATRRPGNPSAGSFPQDDKL